MTIKINFLTISTHGKGCKCLGKLSAGFPSLQISEVSTYRFGLSCSKKCLAESGWTKSLFKAICEFTSTLSLYSNPWLWLHSWKSAELAGKAQTAKFRQRTVGIWTECKEMVGCVC